MSNLVTIQPVNPNPNPVTIQPVKLGDVTTCRPFTPKSKFEEGMEKLLATLMSGFTNANHDVRLLVRGNKDEHGFGRSETSIWTDARTQVRLLENKTQTKTDMRSIVTRTLDDGTILGVTTASQNNARGELTAAWTRYTTQSTLGEDRGSAKKTLAKLLNISDMDESKDVKVTDEVRIISNGKGETTATEFTKVIKYTDTNGQSHEQRVTVTMDANNKQQKVEMTLNGKKQELPANANVIAGYVHYDTLRSYENHESEFDELANLGDYGAYDVSNDEVKAQPINPEEQNLADLQNLMQILKQILWQLSQNGPQQFDQIFKLLDMANSLTTQIQPRSDVRAQI